jgi:hypothetical protein
MVELVNFSIPNAKIIAYIRYILLLGDSAAQESILKKGKYQRLPASQSD